MCEKFQKNVTGGQAAVHRRRYLQYVTEPDEAYGLQDMQRQDSLFPCVHNDGSKLLPRPISLCEIDKGKGHFARGIPGNRRKDRNGRSFPR